MPFHFSQFGPPLLTMALVMWLVYRRLRRTFGRQLLAPRRMLVRIVILGVIGALLLPVALRSTQGISAMLLGILIGALLAWWGASQTRYLRVAGRQYFIPHTYTGIVVSMLFVGRLAYRFAQLYAGGHFDMTAPDAMPFGPAMVRSPLTLGIFYVLVAYYVGYYSTVLRQSKRITPDELEPA